jgi:hypothetical protein
VAFLVLDEAGLGVARRNANRSWNSTAAPPPPPASLREGAAAVIAAATKLFDRLDGERVEKRLLASMLFTAAFEGTFLPQRSFEQKTAPEGAAF